MVLAYAVTERCGKSARAECLSHGLSRRDCQDHTIRCTDAQVLLEVQLEVAVAVARSRWNKEDLCYEELVG